MNEPLLTDEAKNDLVEIWATLAEARDERTADRMNQKIYAMCRVKAQFPETGRLREDIGPGLRSAIVRPYVFFFGAPVRPPSFCAFCAGGATLNP